MAVYTVFEPPPSGDELRDAERVQFVREGFSWLALLVPFVWLIWHRMWLVLVLWIAVSVLVQWGASLLGEPAPLIGGLAVALLMGFEASSLRRWTLARRGFRFRFVIAGANRDECERRFFSAWAWRDVRPGPGGPPPAGLQGSLTEGDEVRRILGLFPDAERSR
jgi:hypothetical protein